VSGDAGGAALPRAIDAVLRDLVNALGKATMYPPGHRFIAESAASLVARLDAALTDRDSLTVSILPHGLVVDGTPVEPLSSILREFAVRMHRRNIAVIQLRRGLEADEAATLLAALSANDADETVGRTGLQLPHARLDAMSYDALTLTDSAAEHELDDAFWVTLSAAAFDGRRSDGEAAPTISQLADAISDRAAQDTFGAQRVYEALSGFAAALTGRGGRDPGGGRQRFVQLLSALSRSTATRVLAAAPSPAARRRFLAETLELVPPTLLVQILESVAEADGEAISEQLHGLLDKLARAEGDSAAGFPIQVLGLIQQWDDISDQVDELADPHVGVDALRVLGIGLEVAAPCPAVFAAARGLADGGRLVDALTLLDDTRNDVATVRAISNAMIDPALLHRLLAEPLLDVAMIERIGAYMGTAAVDDLLDALAAATDRTMRRRLLDILVRIGPGAESTMLARLPGAPWYLARNILAVLAQFSAITNVEPVLQALGEPELRVRQEALKVLVRQPGARDRSIVQALASGEESLVRMALTALGSDCPRQLVPAVLGVVNRPPPELQVLAIHVLAENDSSLIVPRLLPLVCARRGIFRRLGLQPRSPVMLAALQVLARRWRKEASVAPVLAIANASHDADVRTAIGGTR